MNRVAAFRMLSRVRDEMEAARFALSVVLRNWDRHMAATPAPSGTALSHEDLRRRLENLEVTYILRLFGMWEAVLRDYWLNGLGRPSRPDLKPLVESLAGRRTVDSATVATVHDLRDFRNEIVHENLRVLRYDYSQVAKGFSKFVAYLPPNW